MASSVVFKGEQDSFVSSDNNNTNNERTRLVEKPSHIRKESIVHNVLNLSHSWLTIVTYFWSFVVVGIFLTLLGPAFPDLQEQSSASNSQMSVLFLANGILYALGSVLFGVVLERMPHRIHLFNSMLLCSCIICILSLLMVHDFLTLFIVCSSYSLFVGMLDTCGNVAMMAVIREEPDLDYTMQLLQSCVSGGAVVGSLFTLLSSSLGWHLKLAYLMIAVVAVPPTIVSYLNLHRAEVIHERNQQRRSNKVGQFPQHIKQVDKPELSAASNVGHSLPNGSIYSSDSFRGVSHSLISAGVIANDHPSGDRRNSSHRRRRSSVSYSITMTNDEGNSDDINNTQNPKYMMYSLRNCALVIFSAMSMIFAMCLEMGFGAYLTQFTIKHVRAGNSTKGRIFEFIYYTCGCLSRASAALNWISITKLMILASMSNVLVSGIFIYFNQELDSVALCSGLFGLTITPVFGSLFTFVEFSNVEVTGLPSGLIMLGAGIGASLGPSIIGLVSDTQGFVWFPYLMFFYSVCLCISLTPMILIAVCVYSK